ncbi:hypothetical protein BFJ63_vAg19002 [Fusarium oxysporum f. sp. narcissi]|uniref:Uncharacterized protein n=1 Tax=Fusarium oxysporum f. sp. narcissi TaxID=451672 RepID=A0A4Q2UVY9_FUSOX|nr:hypothetical protein BFJ63_vAg19002 [Fusarium oxysporum f. sp. narcissi]
MAGEEVDVRKSAQRATPHFCQSQAIWTKVEQTKQKGVVFLNGTCLDPALVITVAKWGHDATINTCLANESNWCKRDPHVNKTNSLIQAMESSVKMLEGYLNKNCCDYSAFS